MNLKINIENLVKSYQNQKILCDLNFSVSNIKVLGIIGESGCGKSTLLRQLSGIEFSDYGSIRVNDISLLRTNIKEYQKKIGVVFQNHNLFPHLTVEENINLVLEKARSFSRERSNAITNGLLRDFFLEEIKNKKPRNISGGQAQRASIARALAGNPELVFLDEPTASLDPVLTKEVLESIEMLKNLGVEFIFVTHEMDFLKKFADYFIFLDKGKILEHGQIDKLNNPATKELNFFLKGINI
ncbi:amino acid ABC transporter ATP-binding protein [Fusobacterium sp. IOR10]|uniref:amino acid ABC transporter ATP-binding protein n=1 Tax=Fusobacterium sp. IOR10 TaxID=2665157 RepID=UPI0013D6EDA9|nr:ATP-binding cassette domain-containing protein [Fusobacterium sp. IOR10]